MCSCDTISLQIDEDCWQRSIWQGTARKHAELFVETNTQRLGQNCRAQGVSTAIRPEIH